MKQRKLALALATVFMTAGLAPAVNAANGPDVDRVMVKFKKGAKARVKDKVGKARGHIHRELDHNDIISATLSVDEIEQLKRDGDVISVEVDAPRYPLAETTPWGITRVQAAEAIAAGADGEGIKVCVIDSGAYAGHEDFSGVPMTGHANDGDDWASDTCGHGTHVAGTIAAAANDTGVVGVSPDGNVALHIVKVFDTQECEWTYSSDLIAAAEECQEAGADIINMSLGGEYASTFERDAFDRLYAEGVLSFAASGNDWSANYNYPAAYDSVVSVGAVDENNARASFSQYNDQVELAAPGVGVLSTESWRDSHLVVGGETIVNEPFRGTMEGTAAGELVDGGNCGTVGDWAGKVVMCERGGSSPTSFWNMAQNVAAADGSALLIYNNVAGPLLGWFGANNTSTIPALGLTQPVGQALLADHLGDWVEVSSMFEQDANAYGYKDGTSMATPHVAGVAALVWSAAPEKTNRDVRFALGATAIDIDQPGYDVNTGFGLVQAADAANELVNGGGSGTGSAPRFLIADSEWTQNNSLSTTLFWTAGDGAVDVVRNDAVVMGGISNTGTATFSDKPSGDGTWLYRVCNAGTSDCSNTTTVNFDGRDVPPNNNGKVSTDAGRSLALASGEVDQSQPRITSMSGGDSYVTWQNGVGNFDILLQRVDRKGRSKWKNEVVAADRNLMFTTVYGMDLATDIHENALVSYRIEDENGQERAWVQKISPDGEKLWGENGIFISDSFDVLAARVVGTPDGGAVVMWQSNNAVFLQKYDADGNALWGEQSIEVNKPAPYSAYYTFYAGGIQANDDGSVVISFKSSLGRYGAEYWAQKYDANGQPMWAEDHVRLFAESGSGMPNGGSPEFISDDAGGGVFCWYYTWAVSSTDVRVQRVTADGTPLFPVNGAEVSTDEAFDRNSASCSYDADTGETYVGFVQRNAGYTAYGILAQKFDAAGNRLWGDSGREIVPMSPGAKGAVSVLPADDGAIFAWGLNDRPAPMYLQASALDADGHFAWSDEIMTFKSAASWVNPPVATVDNDGRAIFVWPEFISYQDRDIMMQTITADGRIGK